MKTVKRGLAVALSLALAASTLSFVPAQAAKKPKLSKKKVSVKVGSTVKLTVKNASKKAKVTWKTSKKKVVKITKKSTKGKKAYAKIKGVKKGSAVITAVYKAGKTKKKLTCKVTVKTSAKPGTEDEAKTDPPAVTTAAAAPTNGTSAAPTNEASAVPTNEVSAVPTNEVSAVPTNEGTIVPTESTSAEPTNDGTAVPTADTTVVPTVEASATPTEGPTGTPTSSPTVSPSPTPKQTFVPNTQSYEFFNDYTLGYDKGIVAYKDGKKTTLDAVGAGVYNKKSDNIFAQHIKNNNWWEDKIMLTAPIQYTTGDGKAYTIDSMLTNFDFMADPTAIDNSDKDGKLYVYATTEGIDYSKGTLAQNGYNNHSLSIVSTQDMVNWTDEGTLDNQNLTNLPSEADSKDKVKNKWGSKAWAPSGLKIDGDGDGEDEYYLFYTNGGAVGYVQGDSPTGPWKDDLGKVLFNQSTPNCENVKWCFDPAVLVDDKGDAYVYFGGGVWNGPGEAEKHPEATVAQPKTGRVCKIKFEEGTGKVLLDGDPQIMDTHYLFEDSEINMFNGKYYYSYCTNFDVPNGDKWVGSGQIAVYVSSDPMKIAFDPTGANGDKFTDADGIYHNYLGTVLENPSTIYGESYNNHHHMQSFKGHDYIFYHSTVLGNTLFRDNKQYRNLHVDEITVDKETDGITINPSYEGASQIEDFDPYKNVDGSVKYINATTAANSAGVKSTRDDIQVAKSINGSPMVLDEIDTGDWTCIKGVNFGTEGLQNFGVEYKSNSDYGRIEMFIDSPTDIKNKVASIDITANTEGKYEFHNTATTQPVTGKHDVYFVFRGDGYKVASWIFSEKKEGSEIPDVSDRPVIVDPEPTPEPVSGWNEAKTEYTLPISEDNVRGDGGGTVEFGKDGSVTVTFNPSYPGIVFTFPEDTADKFSSIEFTYKDSTDDGKTSCGGAARYTDQSGDQEIKWNGLCPAGEGLKKQVIELDSSKEFVSYKIFRNECSDCHLTITSVVLKK